MHEGQQPRDLQENGTRSSSPQLRQQVRTKPSSKSPQPAKPSSSAFTNGRQRPRLLLAALEELREHLAGLHRGEITTERGPAGQAGEIAAGGSIEVETPEAAESGAGKAQREPAASGKEVDNGEVTHRGTP